MGWSCICEKRYNSHPGTPHSEQCLEYYEKCKRDWDEQDHQCSGSGFSHGPHGKCLGYGTDRT